MGQVGEFVSMLDKKQQLFEAKYEEIDVQPLGEGTYGQVFKARCRDSGRMVALKKMKTDDGDEGVPSTALREIALLKELRHENVVELIDQFCTRKKLTLVFEYVEHDLKKYTKKLGRLLLPQEIQQLAQQLCAGIEFCHANRILHRDLKPQNLLVDNELRLKIADFGLARAYSVPIPKYTHEVVTIWYRAPEILLGQAKYSVPVDIWSIGCIFAEMATGLPLFQGDSEIETIFKVFQKLGTPTEAVWPGLKKLPEFKSSFPQWTAKGWENIRNTKAQVGLDGIDLLNQMLAYDPRARVSARLALQHRYFHGPVCAATATLQEKRRSHGGG